jgi:hypothetical protein
MLLAYVERERDSQLKCSYLKLEGEVYKLELV